jgi:hypothetical protein
MQGFNNSDQVALDLEGVTVYDPLKLNYHTVVQFSGMGMPQCAPYLALNNSEKRRNTVAMILSNIWIGMYDRLVFQKLLNMAGIIAFSCSRAVILDFIDFCSR